ncbi:MAG: glycosyltransferase family 2 protein [Clostridia bacterium]|nr:glycosyltransferase family 2 protein [Clostridia bacterium]
MDVKVSVIIPVFKVEKYLDRCVKSIFSQTYKNLEIILVDDGSPDNCPAMCDGYAKEDSRVTVIHKKNGGLSDARNFGMNAATGKYILFVDSDDWIEPDTAEELVKIIEDRKVDFVNFRAVWDGRAGIPDGTPCNYEPSRELDLGLYDRERMKSELYPRLLVTPDLFLGPVLSAWSGFYNREFLDSHNIRFDTPIKYSEDSVFSARVVMAAESFAAIDRYFYHYCFNGESISFGTHSDWWDVAKIRYGYYEKYFADCENYDFTVQFKRMAIFCVLDGLSEWKAYASDEVKLSQIRMVMNDEFSVNAMKHIGAAKVPLKKKFMLCLIKFRMARLYFWIFNEKKVEK